ncbi:nuclear transport factor 2 family protein [Aestuariibaculum lutulentum]|uniref:Nuclear transport factor 2 family protein n=1 Tax=Aestuariibaculum lutulentum TaxID=2920935 RepID=A0ABS9RNS3_9FLAO|nr:nuclear transport factor 2 family protein [Aestuariibaculum lutulentum]MCH4553774.1 nuclear transport factor 2 family protein [Aestuariibaculum lutulentum]
MKSIIVLIAVCFVLFFNCSHEVENPELLKKVLINYFDGIKTQDLDELNRLTTEDFVLFENGLIWTNDSLVRENPKMKSVKRHWQFDFKSVEINGDYGDIVYYNHGSFVINDSIYREIDWLESATFKKVNDQWKLKFLHSTVRK